MDVYGRLARFFLDLARQSGKSLDNDYIAVIRPTHQAIANMIGTSRETVSRLIHDLMKQNLLLSEGKTIYLASRRSISSARSCEAGVAGLPVARLLGFS